MMIQKTKARAIFAISIVILVLGGLAYLIWVPRAVQVDVAQVLIGDFKETIHVDGVLRSKDRYTVTAFAEGELKRVSLKAGDPVEKGAVLTELLWDVRYIPVKAPIGGVISKVYRESAGPIHRGEPILEIVDPLNLEIVAEMLTTDAIRLRAGGSAWIVDWANGAPVEAKVKRISKAGFTKPSALGVEEERTEVIAELLNPADETLRAAGSIFHVNVVFDIQEIKNALKVPVGALFRDGADWAVYLAQSGRSKKVKVQVDAIGEKEAVIRSGLKSGQWILVYPGDLVRDGSRIKFDQGTQR